MYTHMYTHTHTLNHAARAYLQEAEEEAEVEALEVHDALLEEVVQAEEEEEARHEQGELGGAWEGVEVDLRV